MLYQAGMKKVALLLIVFLAGCQGMDAGRGEFQPSPTNYGRDRDGDPIYDPYLAWQRE
jgi:hypothetical protein